MNIDDTIAPKSDQANADDLLSGPRTFTVGEVRKGPSPEQPVEVLLQEFPADRPWRPSKSMRRVLVAAWGADASAYVGRRLTLFCDPEVRFGGAAVGGIRVSHMSDLKGNKAMTLALTVTRGRRAPYVVKPLADAPAPAQERPKIKPNVEALIENAQEARHNADLDDVARAAAGLTGADLDAVKAVVTARRAELAEPTLPEGAGSVATWGGDAA